MKLKKYWVGKVDFWLISLIAVLLIKLFAIALPPYIDDFIYLKEVKTLSLGEFLRYSVTEAYFRPIYTTLVYGILKLPYGIVILRILVFVMWLTLAFIWYNILKDTKYKNQSLPLIALAIGMPLSMPQSLMAISAGDVLFYLWGGIAFYFSIRENFLGLLFLGSLFFVKEQAIFIAIVILYILRNKKPYFYYALGATAIGIILYFLLSRFTFAPTTPYTIELRFLPHLLISSLLLAIVPIFYLIDLVNFTLNFANPITTLVLALFITTIVWFFGRKTNGKERQFLLLTITLLLLQQLLFFYFRVNPLLAPRLLFMYSAVFIFFWLKSIKLDYLKGVTLLFILLDIIFVVLGFSPEKFFRVQLAFTPRSPAVHMFLGDHFYRKQDMPSAEKEYKLALYEHKKNEKLRWKLVKTLEAQRKYTEARQVFLPLEAKALKEKDYKTLGRLYEKVAPYIAVQYYERAGEFRKVGDVYFSQNAYDTALIYYRKALAQGFDEKSALRIAYIFQKRGILGKAEIIYKRILAHNPKNKFAINNLGIIAAINKDYIKAKMYFEQALKLDPNFIEAEKNLERLNKKYLK